MVQGSEVAGRIKLEGESQACAKKEHAVWSPKPWTPTAKNIKILPNTSTDAQGLVTSTFTFVRSGSLDCRRRAVPWSMERHGGGVTELRACSAAIISSADPTTIQGSRSKQADRLTVFTSVHPDTQSLL